MTCFGATLNFRCDKCTAVYLMIKIQETVDSQEELLKKYEWTIDGNRHLCPSCSKGGNENELEGAAPSL